MVKNFQIHALFLPLGTFNSVNSLKDGEELSDTCTVSSFGNFLFLLFDEL